jgi:hypothetical protein
LKSSRLVAIFVLVAAVGAASTAVFYVLGTSKGTSTSASTTLPTGCVKPPDGFLIIASENGFNDSIDHGVPANDWPIINVTQGQTVSLTVCNTDFQAHGFQVSHYYDSNTVTLVSGQVIHVTFVANLAGRFKIYCNIFCSIHWAMQSGLLNVFPT